MVKVLRIPGEWSVGRIDGLGLAVGLHYHDQKPILRPVNQRKLELGKTVELPSRTIQPVYAGVRLI